MVKFSAAMPVTVMNGMSDAVTVCAKQTILIAHAAPLDGGQRINAWENCPAPWKSGAESAKKGGLYFCRLRRITPTRPVRPDPSNNMLAGSGTAAEKLPLVPGSVKCEAPAASVHWIM